MTGKATIRVHLTKLLLTDLIFQILFLLTQQQTMVCKAGWLNKTSISLDIFIVTPSLKELLIIGKVTLGYLT